MNGTEFIIFVSVLLGICILVCVISVICWEVSGKKYDKTIALQKKKYPDLYELNDEWHKYIDLFWECHKTVSQLKEMIDYVFDNEKYYNKEDYWTAEKLTKLADTRTQYKENEEKLKEYNQKCNELEKQLGELKDKYGVKYL